MAKSVKKTAGKKPAAAVPAAVEGPQKKVEPINPEFEKNLEAANAGPVPGEQGGDKVERRGGARPGAGRPAGLSDELSRINKLPDVPNKAISNALQMPFELWSIATKVKELALSDDEADDLALPITQLLAYYWPDAYDHIAWIYLCLMGCVTKITVPRFKLLADLRKQRQAERVSSVAGGGPGGPAQPSSVVPSGAAGFPQKQ